MEEQVEQIREACMPCRAREFRVARTAEERDLLWKGRKNAFGAVGRVSPTYYVQDGVVPRTKIAPTLRYIQRGVGAVRSHHQQHLSRRRRQHASHHSVRCAQAGRAGTRRKAGEDILEYCIAAGGSITGEHGVGMEKMELIGRLFSDDSLEMMRRFKELFDPTCHFNPGKILPTGKGCMEIRQPSNMVL